MLKAHGFIQKVVVGAIVTALPIGLITACGGSSTSNRSSSSVAASRPKPVQKRDIYDLLSVLAANPEPECKGGRSKCEPVEKAWKDRIKQQADVILAAGIKPFKFEPLTGSISKTRDHYFVSGSLKKRPGDVGSIGIKIKVEQEVGMSGDDYFPLIGGSEGVYKPGKPLPLAQSSTLLTIGSDFYTYGDGRFEIQFVDGNVQSMYTINGGKD